MENSNLHLEIRKARIKQGLSQKELGEMVGLPQQAINRIEQGQRKLDVELFEKLCKSLNIKKIGSFTVNFISSYYKMDVGDDPICYVDESEDDFPTDDPLSYENSYSFASSEEELNKLQKERQIAIEKKKHCNIHKYDASIHTEITPEQIEINRIQNKILNDKENITENELKILTDYYHSEQFKNSFKRLREVAQSNLEIINRLQNAYEKLNENGQEKVAEHAEMIAKIPEYRKVPDEPPQE